MKIHPDFDQAVSALHENNVQFLIVGSFALAYHGFPRATGDIDFWIRPTSSNTKKLLSTLKDFGVVELDISEEDILSGKIIQLGVPPVRIDLITVLTGLTSELKKCGKAAKKLNSATMMFSTSIATHI